MSTSMYGDDVFACAGDLDGGGWYDDIYWSTVAVSCNALWQDDIASESFCFESIVPSSEARPVQPLAPDGGGWQFPPQSPSAAASVLERYPCQKSGSSASGACNFDIVDGHYPVISDQEFSGFSPACSSGTVIDAPNSDSFTTQGKGVYTLLCVVPAPGARVGAAPASPTRDRPGPQQKLYRCGLQITEAESPFKQTTCGQTFARSKDLERHKSTVHREDDDPVYLCRCGKDNPRKDNHARHVEVCVKPPRCPRPYVCKCSYPSEERHDHLEHVKSCSPGKGSRRRRNAS